MYKLWIHQKSKSPIFLERTTNMMYTITFVFSTPFFANHPHHIPTDVGATLAKGPGAGDRQARSCATAHFGAANGLGNLGVTTRGIVEVPILEVAKCGMLGETIDQMILNQKLSHNFPEFA